MPITFAHAAFAVVLSLIGSLTSASAADMAHRSRLGAVFAEPTKVVRGAVVTQDEVVVVDPGYVRTSPRVAGYYGRGRFPLPQLLRHAAAAAPRGAADQLRARGGVLTAEP